MPAIATQTCHDAISHERITTIYLDQRAVLKVCEQHDGAPVTRQFLAKGTAVVAPLHPDLTFERTVTAWCRQFATAR